jgi:hypothetical protein
MYKIEKTLSKTTTHEFSTLREVYEWASKNRYIKNKEVRLYKDGVLVDVNNGNVARIYDLFSWTLKQEI